MISVILPVLDEAAALPGVLGAMPDGYRPIVVDNGSVDGSAEIAAGLGAEVVTEPRRGFGAACFRGLEAAETEIVCFMDCDGSLDPRELPLVTDPITSFDQDLVLGSRQADPGAWPVHARFANTVLAAMVRRRCGVQLTDLGPMRAARREALLDLQLQDRRFGWPLEMVLRAAEAQWRIGEVEVAYRKREGRSKVTGTVRGTVRTARDMAKAMRMSGGSARVPDPCDVTVIVIAKEPLPGKAKTRLAPALGTEGASHVAEAALADTLATVAGVDPRRPLLLALDGEPGDWLPPGFRVVPQRGEGLAERLAAAFEDAGGPAFLVGMDTPQLTVEAIETACERLCSDDADAVLGLAPDGGWWGLGLRRPDPRVFEGVPMSEEHTGAAQIKRLEQLGLDTRLLEEMVDVDTIEDATEVAALVPESAFAAALASALAAADGVPGA